MPVLLVYDTTCSSVNGNTCSWVVPAGVTSAVFEVWGGGGGGGGGICTCDCCSTTQGGGGGGYAMKSIPVSAGQTYVLCAGNAGTDSTGTFGAPVGWEQTGVDGGKSFVTGPNMVANFCATGGKGGQSNFTINCYGHCGCHGGLSGSGTAASGGLGYNGDLNYGGTPGLVANDGGGAWPYSTFSMGGNAGGPGGGAGGYVGYTCCYTCADNGTNGAYNMHGAIPGGGGSGHFNGQANRNCGCTQTQSGRGGPGLVRVTY
jgi:hypothetical protein